MTMVVSRSRTINKRLIVRLSILFLILLFITSNILYILLPVSTKGPLKKPSNHHVRRTIDSQHRLAILLPFVGTSRTNIPTYLNLFCAGAAGSASIVDFLIIHNGVLDHAKVECPENVIFISLGNTNNFAEKLAKVVDHKENNISFPSREHLVRLLAKHLEIYPYALVEFKPALGFIFAEYIQKYTHWGYADLDMIFGDLPSWISADEWNDFDIVTYGYGDQHRLYVRGQFTFHKNTPPVNELWRGCAYLANMDDRFKLILEAKDSYRFESAEGCYSWAILNHKQIRVKFASKAWTDVQPHDTSYGIYLSKVGKRLILYKTIEKDVLYLPPNWFQSEPEYAWPLQRAIGAMEQIELPNNQDAKCMYWAQRKYQGNLCLDDDIVEANDTVYWVDGKLYKQRHLMASLPVSTAPFFHFQEWKRYYRHVQLAPLRSSSSVSTFVITKEGVLPLYPKDVYQRTSLDGPPLRRHYPKERHQFPGTYYCLISGPRMIPSKPPTSECYHDISWQDEETVVILSGAPTWKQRRFHDAVTLVLTLQISSSHSNDRQALADRIEMVVSNLERWRGQPCVVVIHVAGASATARDFIHQRLGVQSDVNVDNALIAVIYDENQSHVSRKALMNMAVDVVPTRWYISGLELERGLVLSKDAVVFSNQIAQTYSRFRGHVFIIPQFAVEHLDRNVDLTLFDLAEEERKGHLFSPVNFEDHCGDGDARPLGDPTERWWKDTLFLMSSIPDTFDENALITRAQSLNELENDIVRLLTSEYHYDLYAKDESPILLIDNLGPFDGMLTHEISREIEEFGGLRCYNGLRMAQLATMGYSFGVVPGAFAVSSDGTRKAVTWGSDESVPGSSRCDGCFMFDDEHEDILEDIISDEMRRPAKAAILWAELTGRKQVYDIL